MSSTSESIRLEDWIRDIPDFPQRGILFKDITPLLQDSVAFHAAMDVSPPITRDRHSNCRWCRVPWLYFRSNARLPAKLWLRARAKIWQNCRTRPSL